MKSAINRGPANIRNPHCKTRIGGRWTAVAVAAGWCLAAQSQGLTDATPSTASLGATGGLTIPSARTLPVGQAAAGAGNYQDPHFGRFGRHNNFTLGFGLWPGLELFGRFTDYTEPLHARPGTRDEIGVRDLSVNLKWQLPFAPGGWPQLAVGATDLAGGAQNFRSFYGVASDRIGPVEWRLGVARGTPSRQQEGAPRVLDGVFGGVEASLPGWPLALLAESDGTQRHAGMRYTSPAQPWLGDGQLVATVQRSFGARDWFNQASDRTSMNLQWVVPLGTSDVKRQGSATALAQARPLPERPATGAAAAGDWAARLVRVLSQTGLERVRVGMAANVLVVAYENRSYLHHEMDALALVLGVAAELAPPGARQVRAVTHKAALPVAASTVDVVAYRTFLRDGQAGGVRAAGLQMVRGAQAHTAGTTWLAGSADAVAAPVRLEIRPLLNYTLGTEVGAFDHSLAANFRLSTTPWPGALLYGDWVQRVSHSDNMEPGQLFAAQRHRNGLSALALQQSWWPHPAVFVSGGLGLYRYSYAGVEGEAIAWVPGRDDTIHLRGQALQRVEDDVAQRSVRALSGIYRWVWRPDTWIEVGAHGYTDGSAGPSLGLTRWFGDVSLGLVARRGGRNNFVGVELSLPLTPRRTDSWGPLQVAGTARYVQTYRMRLAARDNRGHLSPQAVRPADLALRPEVEWLNAGRLSTDELSRQLPRMREMFYLHARDKLD